MSSGPVGRSAILETEVNRLIRTVTEELGTRGLTTPFLFSSLGTVLIDIISARVRRLIEVFLCTCVSYSTLRRTRNTHGYFATHFELIAL